MGLGRPPVSVNWRIAIRLRVGRCCSAPRTLSGRQPSSSSRSGASGPQPTWSRKTDYVIVDTAGRLQTKANLMAELEKMRRTAGRVIPGAPHEVLLVLDATTGQNGL